MSNAMNSALLITRISRIINSQFWTIPPRLLSTWSTRLQRRNFYFGCDWENCRDVVIVKSPNPKGALDATGTGRPGVHDCHGRNQFCRDLAAMPLDSIDHTATTCNSIHAILSAYGVEAARAAIVQEISAVFAVYGISIDPVIFPHRWLHDPGGWLPAFNRSGMETVASPFLKMTFETTVQYLKMPPSLVKLMSSFRRLRESFFGTASRTGNQFILKFVNQFTNKLLIRRLREWITMIYYEWEH